MAYHIRQLAIKPDDLSFIPEAINKGCPLTICTPLHASPQHKQTLKEIESVLC